MLLYLLQCRDTRVVTKLSGKINQYRSYEHIFTKSFVDQSEEHFDLVFDTVLNEYFLDVAFGEANSFVK